MKILSKKLEKLIKLHKKFSIVIFSKDRKKKRKKKNWIPSLTFTSLIFNSKLFYNIIPPYNNKCTINVII